MFLLAAGCSGHGLTRYEVTAPLLSVGGGPVYACAIIALSLPPAGCGGVVVRGVSIGQVPKVKRYSNGTMLTPSMHLIGTWHGHTLTLTQSVRPREPETVLPDGCGGAAITESQPSVLSLQHQVVHDRAALEQRGIVLLQTGPCGSTLGIVVAVADASTVSYLKSHYGTVNVVGWLHRI